MKRLRVATFVLGLMLVTLAFLNGTEAAVGPNFTSETLITGLNEPTSVNFLPDGRMLILSRYGSIQQVQAGATSVDPTPFLTLTNINTAEGERGLTGFALDANFSTNQYFYLFYTANSPLRDRVSRFTMVGTTASPSSEFVVWEDDVTSSWWHHGGSVLVGPDGKIYISTGDGYDRGNEVQPLTSYRGKILRVNTDGSIPTDNPFVDGVGPNKDEIWARGLRNPFRMSFDPGTGDLYIGDVGANNASTSIEEINRWRAGAPTGLNFGWPNCEGPCGTAGMTNPLFSYPHANRDSAITGGFVYRGGNFPAEYQGSYFYGDYVQNWLKRLTFDAGGNVTGNLAFEPSNGAADGPYGEIVDVKQGPDGALYYVDIGITWEGVSNPGTIRRIKYTAGNQPPVISSVTYDPPSGAAPLTVNFNASATDPENNLLTYSWVFGDGEIGTGPVISHTYSARGPYTARLTVSDGTNQTLSNPLPITVGTPPDVFITAPLDQALFRAGDAVVYRGDASDDGPLTAANYSWRIVMLHDSHTHPAAGPFSGAISGTFNVPTTGHELDASTAFQIILTVTDSDGLQTSKAVAIRPDTVNLSFDTVPTGLTMLIDNLPRTTPITNFSIVKNFQLPISAVSPQLLNGNSYGFLSWSDGQPQTHTLTVPEANTALTATYQLVQGAAGPVAAYSFDEAAGSAVGDASGNGNAGVLSGSVWNAQGKYGSALSFDGIDDWVTVNDSNSLDLSSALTLEAWVYPTSVSGWRTVLMKEQNAMYYLYAAANTGPGAGVNIGGYRETFGSSNLPLNAWSHVAGTYDGTTLRVFVNGTQVSSLPLSGAVPASAQPLRIGGNAQWGEFFQGRIDEIRIYSRALSPTEIQTDMSVPVGPLTTDSSPPTVSVTAPADGASVSGLVSLAAAASDNVGVAGVQFRIDGVNVGAEDTVSPYGASWDSTAVANGSHQVSAVARDQAGNQTTSGAVSVTTDNAVDNQAPTVSVTAPAAGASVSGLVSLAAAASDNVGVVGVQFRIDGVNVGAEDTVSPYGASWDSTAVANGSHQVSAVARDQAGNQTTSGAVAIIVSNGVTTIQGTVTDASAQPVSGATVAITGGPSTVTDAAGLYSFTSVTPGTYIVTVWKSGYTDSASYGVVASSGATTTRNVSLTTSETILVSSTSGGTAGGVTFADEDILGRNQTTGAWSMVFDGSDVGVGGVDVDAFSLLDDGTLLLSFDAPVSIPVLGTVDDSDIVRFTPTSLGTNTAGTFSSYLVGSSVALTVDAEDIDAIGFTPDGRLVVSTTGSFTVSGASGNDEDLIVRNAVNTWALYFDGSDVGLNDATSEDVNGVWIDPVSNALYLTTLGNFTVAGLSGAGADVFVCALGTLGDITTCTYTSYWVGASNGFAGEITDGVHLVRKRP